MSTQELTQEQIRIIGLEVLARELGATGLIRFLQMYEQGSGNYTNERTNIVSGQTVAQIAERISRRRTEKRPS
ncbi:MAG: hypothetical protein ACR2GW_06245 [Pyrinomonadaceae bacterium]|nr:hypothetical protein [Pyrinomonadaceae bacterium]MDQ3586713.1 hypothetical protein [Acidobacteriota bacterium]